MNTSTTLANVTSIAIGGFDGIHLGHQKLFSALDEKHGAVVVIETGHANMTMGMSRQKYTHHPIKIYQLADIKHLDAQGFVNMLCKDFPKLNKIVVGYDFNFGKNRAYDESDLRAFFHGEVTVIGKVSRDDEAIHSHVIRDYLRSGDIESAKHFLGRDYSIEGFVISGQGLGRKELVPTINVQTQQLLPKDGVYATLTRMNNEVSFHPSVTFIGNRASTDEKESLETHILDKHVEDVTHVEIVFIHYMRENIKFDTLNLLKTAIESDINKAKKIFQVLSL